MELTGVQRLNRWFDRLPRASFHLGAREVPAFRSIGILGFHLAVLTALLTGWRVGIPVLDTAAISATAALSFFAWAFARRAVTGQENLVLLEHVWVALAAVALYRWVAGDPVASGLDVLAVSLCVFLAAGRVGCLIAGCCHGYPAPLGPAYPSSAGLPDRLDGVRLFPVQLIEAVALLGIGTVGFVAAGSASGSATVWVLAAYATVRFGMEALRGDTRAMVAGVPVARVMSVIQFLGAILASETWLVADSSDRRRVAAAAPLVLIMVASVVLDRRRRDPLATPEHLDEMWSAIKTLARSAPVGGHPVASSTTRVVHLAASWCEAGLHVSLSHPTRSLDGLPYAFGLAPVARTRTAIHLVVPATRAGPAPEPAVPERRSGPSRTASTDQSSNQLAISSALPNPESGYFGTHHLT